MRHYLAMRRPLARSLKRFFRGSSTALVLLGCVLFKGGGSISDAYAQEMAPLPALVPPPPMGTPPSPTLPNDPNSPGSVAGPGAYPAYPGAEQATVAKLDEAEREDSGRKFELFWFDAQLGASYIDMRQFSSETLAIEKASAGGPMFALGAGVRFVLLTLGVRARYNALSSFNMWQINGEIGFKIPIRNVDLLFGLHGGYSFVGSLGEGATATNSGNTQANSDAVKVRGFNAGLDLAVDYYVTPTVSVGGGFVGDFLLLNRPPVGVPAGLTPDQQAAVAADPLYQRSGTSAGLQLGGALRLGFHFGL